MGGFSNSWYLAWLCAAGGIQLIYNLETQPHEIPQLFFFNNLTMEDPDKTMPSETEFPVPPTYEKAGEIKEFDASGHLVATVTVLRGSLVEYVGYSYGDSSLLPPEYLVKYPESRVAISVSCISILVNMRV